jgi:hypothetical protein
MWPERSEASLKHAEHESASVVGRMLGRKVDAHLDRCDPVGDNPELFVERLHGLIEPPTLGLLEPDHEAFARPVGSCVQGVHAGLPVPPVVLPQHLLDLLRLRALAKSELHIQPVDYSRAGPVSELDLGFQHLPAQGSRLRPGIVNGSVGDLYRRPAGLGERGLRDVDHASFPVEFSSAYIHLGCCRTGKVRDLRTSGD